MTAYDLEQVFFTAPKQVAVKRTSGWRTAGQPLESPDHVLVQTIASAVSSGTEMLVYRGELPKDIPVDSVFDFSAGSATDQEDKTYPISYGYCNVGRIIEVGEHVDAKQWIHRVVFSFQPHVSYYTCALSNVIPVPQDISPFDALFLPNTETAVTLLMDAHLYPGEKVAVFGQGVVGTLVAAAIKSTSPLVTVIGIDIQKNRLDQSKAFGRLDHVVQLEAGSSTAKAVQRAIYSSSLANGTNQAQSTAANRLADVSIEISGSGNALEYAVEATADEGTVIIGSWYGTKAVHLYSLGARFHRSHMKLVASQVSELPSHLSKRWTKSRRFEVVWELVRNLQPKSLISDYASVNEAAFMYDKIDRGESFQTVFKFSDP